MRTSFIAIALFALGASAQSIADIPACGLPCFASTPSPRGCTLVDQACLCQDTQFQAGVTTCVAASTCTDAERQTVASVSGALCAAAGFPLQSASVSSAVASSSAMSSSMASSAASSASSSMSSMMSSMSSMSSSASSAASSASSAASSASSSASRSASSVASSASASASIVPASGASMNTIGQGVVGLAVVAMGAFLA